MSRILFSSMDPEKLDFINPRYSFKNYIFYDDYYESRTSCH